MQKRSYLLSTLVALSLLAGLTACDPSDHPTVTPLKKVGFQNDVIKRTLGPNVVGLEMEFAFAMALPATEGKLTSAQVEALSEAQQVPTSKISRITPTAAATTSASW